MGRSYQHIGLKPEAKKWIDANVKIIPNIVCPKCQHIITTQSDAKIYEECDVFFGDGPWLQEYVLKDGSKVKEIIQLTPWSSGPMVFLCLEKDKARMFEWTGKEINEIEPGLVEDTNKVIYDNK